MNQQARSRFDTVVVGSGPGGASVARALARQGQRVLILEMGDYAPLRGEFLQMARIAAIPGKGAFIHADLSLVMRAITVGGSSAINFATAMAPPLQRFQGLGIELSEYLARVKHELPVGTLPDALVGPMARVIQQSALALGHDWQPLEKLIDTTHCHSNCHRCAYGCPYGAKWTARNFVEEAIDHGAKLFERARVIKVDIRDQCARAVLYKGPHGLQEVVAENVVLAAGGIGSPRILAASGIEHASDHYFVDPVVMVMGELDGIQGGREVPMAAGMHLKEQGILLSDLTLPRPLFQMFSAQVGRFNRLSRQRRMLSMMVKVADQPGGRIGPHWINKSLLQQDREKLTEGVRIASEILHHAGARSIFKSHHFAAHPGGSAAIGKVVDPNLQTDVRGLYVCDASVLPGPWGLAPSFSLLCLGERLAEHLLTH